MVGLRAAVGAPGLLSGARAVVPPGRSGRSGRLPPPSPEAARSSALPPGVSGAAPLALGLGAGALGAGDLGRRRRGGRCVCRAAPVAAKREVFDFEVFRVPVRGAARSVGLKRFLASNLAIKDGQGLPNLLPAVLIIHDGPGLPSSYLEPLAAQLCVNGRACFVYDQFGCGLSAPADVEGSDAPTSTTTPTLLETTSTLLPTVQLEKRDDVDAVANLQLDVSDLRDVLAYISEELGEPALHLIGHGYGGALLAEALFRAGLYREHEDEFPALRSVCLLSAASSTALLQKESERLMREAEAELFDTPEDAAKSFWLRHVCGMKPQPACLSDAYAESFPGPGGQRWATLAGWTWGAGSSGRGAWRLRPSRTLEGWELGREEVAGAFREATGGVPLLSIRGQHDFVTDACVGAWRGVRDAARAQGAEASHLFTEVVVGGCGHHAALEDPDGVSAKLRLWLLRAEEGPGAELAAEPDGDESDRADLDRQVISDGRLQLLGRTEARQQLAGWASELSWRAQKGARTKGSRFADPGFSGSGVASHLDGGTQSRVVRRLAEWAWGLPEAGAQGEASVAQALRVCAEEACAGTVEGPADSKQVVCVALWSSEDPVLQAVVCVDGGANPVISNSGAETALPYLRIVGAAAGPGTPQAVKESLVRYVQRLVLEIPAGDVRQA